MLENVIPNIPQKYSKSICDTTMSRTNLSFDAFLLSLYKKRQDGAQSIDQKVLDDIKRDLPSLFFCNLNVYCPINESIDSIGFYIEGSAERIFAKL